MKLDIRKKIKSSFLYKRLAYNSEGFIELIKFLEDENLLDDFPIHERQKKDSIVQSQSNREFLGVTPVEQYMIESGKRLFKGYESYNELNRLTFDLETQGLNPQYHRIKQFGIHTNRGFDKILSVEGSTKEELDKNEKRVIEEGLM